MRSTALPRTSATSTSASAELSRTIKDISHGQIEKGDDSNGSAAPQSSRTRNGAPLPHYLCETTYKKDRLFRVLYAISVLINVAYFAVRVAYIVTGRVKVTAAADATDQELSRVQRQNDAAVIYSSLVLVAELGGFVLVHLGQQMFTRQRTKFTTMTDDNVARLRTVRHGRRLRMLTPPWRAALRSQSVACPALWLAQQPVLARYACAVESACSAQHHNAGRTSPTLCTARSASCASPAQHRGATCRCATPAASCSTSTASCAPTPRPPPRSRRACGTCLMRRCPSTPTSPSTSPTTATPSPRGPASAPLSSACAPRVRTPALYATALVQHDRTRATQQIAG